MADGRTQFVRLTPPVRMHSNSFGKLRYGPA